jgi:hypothetical protein
LGALVVSGGVVVFVGTGFVGTGAGWVTATSFRGVGTGAAAADLRDACGAER